jgi:hypothetical protein
MEVSGQLHALATLLHRSGKNPQNPADRRLGGPQSRSGRNLKRSRPELGEAEETTDFSQDCLSAD